jgi:hypothetical protein
MQHDREPVAPELLTCVRQHQSAHPDDGTIVPPNNSPQNKTAEGRPRRMHLFTINVHHDDSCSDFPRPARGEGQTGAAGPVRVRESLGSPQIPAACNKSLPLGPRCSHLDFHILGTRPYPFKLIIDHPSPITLW